MLLIGELAERVGMSTSAIRYYEQVGLVQPLRRESGRRVFSDQSIGLLRAIRAARSAGFTLEQVRELLAGQAAGGSGWRELVKLHITCLETRVERLQAVALLLRGSLDCGCRAWFECPSIADPSHE
jgi:DNA-binding transcriptional MerR regulator